MDADVVSRGLYNTITQNSSTEKHPKLSQIKSGRKDLVQKEIHEMLNKGAIVEISNHLEGEFISNLLLIEKKD